MIRTTRILAAAGGVAAALALAAPAGAAVRGTVVHRNHRAHSFVVANHHGKLFAIHANRLRRPGRVVSVRVRRLANGTFAARHVRVLGRRHHARLRGTVTWAGRSGAYTVSAHGASILVHPRHRSAGAPAPGTRVETEVEIDDQGDVTEQDTQELGEDGNGVELEGTILAVDQGARTLTLSADDEDQSGQSITVDVPAGFDITAFSPGDEVELHATPNGDGTFTLTAASDDGNAEQADDQQGDDNGGDETGGDETGGGDTGGGDNGGD